MPIVLKAARAFAAVLAIATACACASPAVHRVSSATTPSAVPTRIQPTPPSLPFGGRTILPGHRVVAFYGAAQTPDMGVLGHAPPQQIARKLLQQAHAYNPYGEPVVPAFELIATVAQRDPGMSGLYRAPTDDATIARYLQAVRAIHGLLILDVQPGRSSFLPEVRRYERFLKQPDVSVALDSEWSMAANEVPADVIGGTTGAAVNAVADYVAATIRRNNLPQKLLIVHQFTPDMVEGRASIRPHAGLAVVYHIDGFGSRAAKLSKYHLLASNRGGAFMGFKLFYTQDIEMFSAAEVMRLTPRPDLITYE